MLIDLETNNNKIDSLIDRLKDRLIDRLNYGYLLK